MNEFNPLDFVTNWDLCILILGITLRFFTVIKKKIEQFNDFAFRKYFDAKHSIRWILHVISSFSLFLFVPQLFVEYIAPKYLLGVIENWNLFGSFLLGFIGYDFIKSLEVVTFKFLGKIENKA